MSMTSHNYTSLLARKSTLGHRLSRVMSKWRSVISKRRMARISRFEQLEARQLLAVAVWTNVLQPLDVSGSQDSVISPLDALLVINELNRPVYAPRSQPLPVEIDDSLTPPFIDVNCSGVITPIDALLVINRINASRRGESSENPLPGQPSWSFEESGGSANARGSYVASACSPKLIEGNSYSSQLSAEVSLPDSNSAIQVHFSAPVFDATSQNAIRDAFEILVLDEAGQPLTLPFEFKRDAAYNWSDNVEPIFGAGTQVTSLPSDAISTTVFNLSGVAAGTKVQVVARLLNNDADTLSSVVIRRIDVISAAQPAPAGMAVENVAAETTAPILLSSLTDVSQSVTPIYGRTTLLNDNSVLITELQMHNQGTSAISDRLLVAIDNLSEPTVGVLNPDGFLPGGRPYFNVGSTSGNGWLATGESTGKKELRFANPNRTQFTYSLTTLVQLNSTPSGFISLPLSEIEAGRSYQTKAIAVDPDNQPLTYSVVAGPEGMSIDQSSGDVRWVTQSTDVGNHSVILKATDPYGLSVQQSFTLSVVATLPNRPPIFTSTPLTEATVAGAFEVQTLRTGARPVAVSAGDFGTGKNFITVNADDANLMLSDGAHSSIVSVGELPSDGRYFRTGTNVDIGMPGFASSSDSQKLDSIAQADLNGDGNLDFVVANYVVDAVTPGTPRSRFLAVSLGRGDGSFSEPIQLPIRTVLNDGNEDQRPVTSLVIRDFDGDQILDLLAVSYVNNSATEQNQLLFWQGLGDGNFATVSIRDPGAYIGRIRTADIDRDGELDLVATSASWDKIGLMRGMGDGTFGPFAPFFDSPGAGYFHTEGIADFDGMNGPDIAITSYHRQQVDIFLNDGSGVLSKTTSLAVGTTPVGLFTGDFTGDGFQDIVGMNYYGSDGGGLALYKGVGDGTFLPAVEAGKSQPLAPINVDSINATVDFNGDGKLDLVFTHHNSYFGITVGLNRGDGNFDLRTYQNATPPAVDGNINVEELSALVGDYNRDGILDLAITTTHRTGGQAKAGLTLLIADSPGHFGAPTDYNYAGTGGNSPFTGINYAADFNNDGKVDLFAVAFQNGHKIRFGNGDGTFQEAVAAAPSLGNEFYNSGFHADFNADGFEDVIWYGGGGVQGGPGARIIVGFNDGSGVFDIRTYNNPDGDYYYVNSLAAGDFNDDGYIDFAGRGSGFVDVWLYDPSVPTTFTRASRLGLPPGEATTGILSAGDFTGDGIDDVVTVTGRSASPQIGSLLHTFASLSDGTFGPIQTQPIFHTNSDAIVPKWSASGDVNNDGNLDFVLTSAYSRASVFLGNGDGSFQGGTDYAAGTNFVGGRNLFLRDLDDDSNLDMLVIDDNQTRGVLRVRFGNGTGAFGPEESYVLPGGSFFTDLADFDNDGAIDVVFGSGQGGYNYSELLFGAGPGLAAIATGDVNGDTKPDLIAISSFNNRVKILHGQSADLFDRQHDLLVGQSPIAVATLDIDADGLLDILTANKLGRSVTMLSNDGAGNFARTDIDIGQRLTALATGNLAGDARPEIVVASEEAKSLFILLNSSAGVGAPVALPLGDVPGQISLGDVTGDNFQDIVVSLPESKRLMILSGDGQGGFGAPVYVQLEEPAGGIGLADFNQDGKLDIAITLPTEGKAAILFGRGGGRFARPQTIAVGENPVSLSIQDWNADGRPDILVANSGDDTLSIIINHYDPTNLYRYSATAIDPDADPITFDLSEAPGGMLFDEVSGQVLWAPTSDQIGLNSVTIAASDGRGGSATQSFSIAVAPARDNGSPVIYSVAPEILDASQVYHYAPTTIDADGDLLRYRLLSGPEGATVDPITGELSWDPRGSGVKTNQFVGDEGLVTVPYTTSLFTPSITVEGFFKLDRTDRTQTFFRKFSYTPYPFIYDTLELKYIAGGTLRSSIAGAAQNDYQHYSWQPEAGQWYHLALTFDDATGAYKVFIDGLEVLSKISDRNLTFDGTDLQIGLGSDALLGAVANFRIWNYALSAEELRSGMIRNHAADTPGLLLDYRFDNRDAQTIRDHSQYGSDGRRFSNRGPWPTLIEGLAFEQTQYFLLQVEDGRGGVSTQSFGVTVIPPIFGSVAGSVFDDLDGDSTRDAGEPGLSGWRVFIDENDNGYPELDEPQTLTGIDGEYLLNGIYAGDHPLAVLPGAGYQTPSLRRVKLMEGEAARIEFAVSSLAGGQIRGAVALDANSNGIANELVVVYSSDFAAPAPDLALWSHPTVTTSQNGSTSFLGEFTNDVVTLTLDMPLAHDILNVSFDLYILKSWDGVNGPDQWQFSLDGTTYVNASFANTGALQSYPQDSGTANNPSRTGAFSVNTLGYTFYGDSIYRFQFSIPHTGSVAELKFRGINLQAASDESWGLNNVVVTTQEPMVAGWPIYIDTNGNSVRDDGELTVLSDVGGQYAFTDLADGTYNVRLDNSVGWTTAAPSNGQRIVVLNGTATGVDFGLIGTADAKSQPRFVTEPHDYATARVAYRFENVAVDPGLRPVQYALEAGPVGMSLDPQTGTLLWTPTIMQVGPQRVILKAANNRGGVAIQDFIIEVSQPNSDPIITSIAPNAGVASAAFEYNVLAQDAEQASLVYSLTIQPSGASINSATGRITWMPGSSQLGLQQFTVQVSDPHGGEALQSFDVLVASGNANIAPLLESSVRSHAPVGLPFTSRLIASDADGDPLTFALISGPTGLTIAVDGRLIWTPSSSQIGLNAVQAKVEDGRGGQAIIDFNIDVQSRLSNHLPVITSQATNFAVAGQSYRYDMIAVDADSDQVAFELVSGPSGLSLDPAQGTVRWVPESDQFGQHRVTLRALDNYGGIAEQSFAISVRAVGGPPAITSVPSTTAVVGIAYLYSVLANDAERDSLSFELLNAPAGMVLNAVTGELAWTPAVADLGPQQIVIKVSDGVGGFATQAFAVVVAAGLTNRPPTITSLPPLYASVGNSLSTSVTATDPENSPITYSLRRGPATMLIDPVTGVISWTPQASDVGTQVVALVATDAGGAATVQSFELNVLAANASPIIRSAALTFATARGTYRYDVLATDINLDPLRFELLDGPTGMTIDAFGRVRWLTTITELGLHSVSLQVSDPRGGVAEQSFFVNVLPDTSAPRVSVVPSVGVVRANSEEVFTRFNLTPVYPTNTVRISAIDDVGITDLSVTANGKPVALDAYGIATFSFKEWGFGSITVVARAMDAAGNQGTAAKAFAFLPYGDDPAVAELANPVVVITSPIDSESLTGFVDIVGSASSDNFTSYTLSYRRGDSSIYKTIATGTSRINDGVLGKWDTTLLENDEYFLRLEVQDEIFGTTAFEESVGVSGDFKLGNFRLSFTDLTIPVAGIPITMTRTYDTLRSDRDSDLGFGWRLEFRNTDLRTSLPKTGLEDLGIYSSFKPGTKVYLTLPGGSREGFTFTPDIRVVPSFGSNLVVATPRFTPDRGVRNVLTVQGGTFIVNQNGSLVSGGGQPYNPAAEEFGGGYTLTTPEGLAYRIDGTSGLLTSAKDRNNNILLFTDAGIRGSNVNLVFERDSQGRITKVIDPAGKSVQYAYDNRGDLVKITNRQGNTTQFVYKTAPAHYLESVIDPLGNVGVRAEYGIDGRLSATLDALGNRLQTSFDVTNDLVIVRDPLGNTSTIEYDSRGNIVAETNALGGVTRTVYDENNNALSITDALGRITRFAYDDSGNVTVLTDPLGNVSRRIYDGFSNPLVVTDPLGNSTRYEYDVFGNLIRQIDALGNVASGSVDSTGSATVAILPGGGTIHVSGGAIPATVTDANGATSTITYDSLLNPVARSTMVTTASGPRTLVEHTEYDSEERVTAFTDPAGSTKLTEYDAAGNIVATVDPVGRRTTFAYDAAGRLVTTQYSDGTSETTTFDAAGQITSKTDRLGRVTRFEYDAAGQLTTVILPDETPADISDNPRVRTEYNLAGEVTVEIDALGRRTTFEYDAAGRRIGIHTATQASERIEYDAAGRQTLSVDAVGRITRFEYDAVGRQTAQILPDGGRIESVYNADGRVVQRSDPAGRKTHFEYTPGGLLTAVIDSLGNRTAYSYDELGRRIAMVDALSRVTRYEYDAVGRQTAVVLTTGQRSETQYDAGGRLISATAFDGSVTTYQYRDSDRSVLKLRPEGTSVLEEYSATGQLQTVTEGAEKTQYEYDARDRLVARIEPDGRAVRYNYDAVGNRTAVIVPSGTTVSTYDAANRLIEVTDQVGITRYEYNAAGDLVRTLLPNGTTESLNYDSAGRLMTQLTTNSVGATLAGLTYIYDTAWRRVAVAEFDGRRTDYSYDDLDRLNREMVTEVSGATRETTYAYDVVGNRTLRVDSVNGTTSYAYDARDRLISETTSAATVTRQYNANGNLTIRDGGPLDRTEYSWDSDNRLIASSDTNGSTSEQTAYRYDADGNMVARVQGGVETRFLLDIGRKNPTILEVYHPDGSVIASYTYGHGRILQTSGGTVTYYVTDALGSVRALTDSTGTITDQFTYSAFGELTGRTGVTLNAFLFTGELRDSLTGLDYLRARHYDPAIGRFVSRDPFPGLPSIPSTLNPYAYVSNNPVSLTDPSGQSPLTDVMTAIYVRGTLLTQQVIAIKKVRDTVNILRELLFWVNVGSSLNEFMFNYSGGVYAAGAAKVTNTIVKIERQGTFFREFKLDLGVAKGSDILSFGLTGGNKQAKTSVKIGSTLNLTKLQHDFGGATQDFILGFSGGLNYKLFEVKNVLKLELYGRYTPAPQHWEYKNNGWIQHSNSTLAGGIELTIGPALKFTIEFIPGLPLALVGYKKTAVLSD